MKKLRNTTLAIIVVVFATPLFSQKIINPDFEEGTGDSTFAVGWYTNQSKTEASLDLTSDSQNQVAKIGSSSNWTKSIRQELDLDVYKFTKYQLSAKMKTKGITGKSSKVYLFANLYNDQGFRVNYVSNSSQNLKEISEWMSFSIEFVAPPTASRLQIGGAWAGRNSGTVWLDDFELTPLTSDSSDTQLSETAENYLQEVVDIMREKALHKEKLNFEGIHRLMRIEANGATAVEDTYPATSKGLRLLNDSHSHFQNAEQIKKTLGVDTIDVEELKKSPISHIEPNKADSLKQSLNYATGELLLNNIGYLRIPGFEELYWEAFEFFADSLQQIIKNLDNKELQGWIVDVRGNWGGVNAAMITGIGPLLDENNRYYYIDADQEVTAKGYYYNGGYGGNTLTEDDSTVMLAPLNYHLKSSDLPIAILMDNSSASAAEVVVAIFVGQPNTKLFGKPSTGLTTANEAVFLSDGSLLHIATLYLADRNKTIYEQGIDPDVEVEFNGKVGEDLENDPVVLKAIEWMKEYNQP